MIEDMQSVKNIFRQFSWYLGKYLTQYFCVSNVRFDNLYPELPFDTIIFMPIMSFVALEEVFHSILLQLLSKVHDEYVDAWIKRFQNSKRAKIYG